MQTRTLFSPAQHSPTARSRYTTLDAFELAVGERLPSQGFPEERLWIFTDGRGMLNVYGDPGDQYDIRQTTALWTTPSIETEIWNTGPRPLHGVIFRVGEVPLPEMQDGMLTWTTHAADGSVAPGSGQNTVYIYEQPRHDEGLHLRIHLIPLRRSMRTYDPAEMLILLPNGHTQRHTHPDIEETIYVLSGSGTARWDDRELPLTPGTALCYPPGVIRSIHNTSDSLLSYICHAARV